MTKANGDEDFLEYLFDPLISDVLIELEKEGKEISYLAKKFSITENKLKSKLSKLFENEFVHQKKENGKILIFANISKLEKALENGKNFNQIEDGLTKMDSYLN